MRPLTKIIVEANQQIIFDFCVNVGTSGAIQIIHDTIVRSGKTKCSMNLISDLNSHLKALKAESHH